jgi:hypothetical protein
MPFSASEGCFWPLVASMRSEVKKKLCPCYLNLNEFWTKSVFFVMLIMTLSGHPWIINKIRCKILKIRFWNNCASIFKNSDCISWVDDIVEQYNLGFLSLNEWLTKFRC